MTAKMCFRVLTVVAVSLFVTSARASEFDAARLERHVATSTFAHITRDPKLADLPQEKVQTYAAVIANRGMACFQSKTLNVSSQDKAIFQSALLQYDDIFEIKDWGTRTLALVDEEYGTSNENRHCDMDEVPASRICRAMLSAMVSGNLFVDLMRCLGGSLEIARTAAGLE